MQQVQRQQLQQKLSPQQIQLMRLLQLPVTDLEQAIKEEIEKNPLLDAEAPEEQPLPQNDNNSSDWDADDDDGYEYDYREHTESDPNAERREFIVSENRSFAERLTDQLALRHISDRQRLIATELIGSLDDAGYLTRDLALITNDMTFRQDIEPSEKEVEEVLQMIQSLEPAGIGARNLQECLLLQLKRVDDEDAPIATEIIEKHFDDFAAHRYDRICETMGIDQKELDDATTLIRRMNPKPGSSDSDSDSAATYVTPDIILSQDDGQLQFYVNDAGLPKLSLNTYYTDMLGEMEAHKGNKETLQFLRAKKADALGFIELLQQRHDTITKVMRYIVKHQSNFLLTGNPDLMQPMRQREVAEATGLDISTVSRMANSKYIQTDFGTIPLKDCFSKGMATESGDEISVETIKQRLADAINGEDKHAPLSDDALTKILNTQGMPLARRTVAKYREQMGFPVARLRRAVILLLILIGINCQAQMSYYDSIINARLNTTAHIDAKAEKNAKAEKVRKEAEDRISKRAKSNQAGVSSESTSIDEVPTYAVPLWYDAFPHHRVNPFGRAKMTMMPDEINLKLVKDTSEFCFPVKKAKTSNYGWRWERGHHGVDIGLNVGDPVHAAFGGTVRVACTMGGYGKCVVIRHPNGLETLYGHLSKINVEPNQEVKAGDIIGLGGNTGHSTGPHLHFECRFMYQTFDPEWILDFSNYSLRTRRLHLDKSYFGIKKPKKNNDTEYKADKSMIKESKNKRSSHYTASYSISDF